MSVNDHACSRIGIGCAKAWEMFLVRRQGRAGLKAYLQSPHLKAVVTRSMEEGKKIPPDRLVM